VSIEKVLVDLENPNLELVRNVYDERHKRMIAIGTTTHPGGLIASGISRESWESDKSGIRKLVEAALLKREKNIAHAKELRQAFELEKKAREADRPAPYVEETKYVVFSYGVDTGLIYPEALRGAIQHTLGKGGKADRVFTGKRDSSRKFPGSYDRMIPRSYVQIIGVDDGNPEHYRASGYEAVWSENEWMLPRILVEAEQKRIDDAAKAIEEEKRAKRQAIFKLAKETGQRQKLWQGTGPCDDPDEECDWDTVIEWALPDGTTKIEREHNY